MNKLIIVSYNIHGLNHPIENILSAKKMQCSIALLQETHLPEREDIKLRKEWVHFVHNASNGKTRRVSILINRYLALSAENVMKDKSGVLWCLGVLEELSYPVRV